MLSTMKMFLCENEHNPQTLHPDEILNIDFFLM
jgi:hypothetical protein